MCWTRMYAGWTMPPQNDVFVPCTTAGCQAVKGWHFSVARLLACVMMTNDESTSSCSKVNTVCVCCIQSVVLEACVFWQEHNTEWMQLQEAANKLIQRLSMPMQEAMSVLAVMIYVATCGNELRILITFFWSGGRRNWFRRLQQTHMHWRHTRGWGVWLPMWNYLRPWELVCVGCTPSSVGIESYEAQC